MSTRPKKTNDKLPRLSSRGRSKLTATVNSHIMAIDLQSNDLRKFLDQLAKPRSVAYLAETMSLKLLSKEKHDKLVEERRLAELAEKEWEREERILAAKARVVPQPIFQTDDKPLEVDGITESEGRRPSMISRKSVKLERTQSTVTWKTQPANDHRTSRTFSRSQSQNPVGASEQKASDTHLLGRRESRSANMLKKSVDVRESSSDAQPRPRKPKPRRKLTLEESFSISHKNYMCRLIVEETIVPYEKTLSKSPVRLIGEDINHGRRFLSFKWFSVTAACYKELFQDFTNKVYLKIGVYHSTNPWREMINRKADVEGQKLIFDAMVLRIMRFLHSKPGEDAEEIVQRIDPTPTRRQSFDSSFLDKTTEKSTSMSRARSRSKKAKGISLPAMRNTELKPRDRH